MQILPVALDTTESGTPLLPPVALTPHLEPALPPILVAEDDPDDTFFIQRFIKKTGVKNPVRVFDDGTEVVNYLSSRAQLSAATPLRRAPLLLFLDLNMGGLGGFGFLEWVNRQRQLVAPLTIVILSNSNEPDDMARALELGASRYLVKYPSVQTFATIIASVYPQVVF
jgi:CheY-like chemotaxis protein